MQISRQCGNKIMTLTFVLLVPAFLMFFFGIVYKLMVVSILKTFAVDNFRQCAREPQPRAIYQHGNYWVMRNYVQGTVKDRRCDDVTLALQGSYADVYKLMEFYKDGLLVGPTSFAVYIPNAQHWNRTLAAIAHVRNCFSLPPVYVGDISKKPIQQHVSFHLYFRFENLLEISPETDVEQRLAEQENCEIEQELLVEGNESRDQQQNAITVGRNIAQLTAPTKFFWSGDMLTYPSYDLFDTLHTNVVISRQMFPRVAETTGKIVFGLPIVLVRNMQLQNHELRRYKSEMVDAIIHNPDQFFVFQGDPFETVAWLKEDFMTGLPQMYSFAEYFPKLLMYPSYFVAESDVPLLDETWGLSVWQSENLRIYSMVLQNYKLAVMPSPYVLRNVTGDKDLMFQNVFPTINPNVREHIKNIFGSYEAGNVTVMLSNI